MIIYKSRKKHLTIQYLLMIKTLSKVGIEENLFNLINNIYQKSTANIILNGEKVEAFLKDMVQGKGVPSYHSFQHHTGSLS